MSLNDKEISAARTEKPRKLYDTDGLYLLVQPSGSKLWRFKYRFDGVEKLISLGAYPAVSLKDARAKRDAARASVAGGTNPSATRASERSKLDDTFAAVAEDFMQHSARKLEAITLQANRWRLDEFLLPTLGTRPIASIEAPEMLRVLRKVEARGLTDTVKRTRTLAGRIFRWGVAHGKCSRDPTQDIRDAFVAPQVKHHAALTDPRQVGELLRAIEGYQGQPATRYALRLLPLVFLRSAELRGARWSEIDLEGATWRVPGSRMKMGDEHVVPLATQAVALLRELQGHTGHGELLFPSLVSKVRPISENTLNGAIKRLGYRSDQQTPHGFRTIASTLLNEQGFSPDLIELQLAHQERNQVRAAYNRAQRLEERRAMMQRWADYIDSLRG